MYRNIQFLGVSVPGRAADPKSTRSVARSHAARVTHARARRERMREYAGADQQRLRLDGDKPLSTDRSCSTDKRQTRRDLSSPLEFVVSAHLDPFNSFARHISAPEQRLFDHFVPLEARHSHHFMDPQAYRSHMATQWVPSAIADAGMLDGVLLFACRSLHILTRDPAYYQLALGYKMVCLRALGEAVSRVRAAGTVRDTTIASALQMASDELSSGDVAACKNHMEAVVAMVKMSGGLSRIVGMNGFLRQMFKAFACRKSLEDVDERS
ncbi:hypothetical protein BX600DRAFT_508401 [Xylariales sp. PMI_506]|nr:hypothetical protein BX600DRAFT_508401 [Xylariales sp. PMI_506]